MTVSMFFQLIEGAGLLLLALYLGYSLCALLARPGRPAEREAPLALTFLIPALNEAQVIAATLHNLRAADPGARLVVIDDGSDDDTAGQVAALAAQDPGVLLLRRCLPEARSGKGEALNWGVRELLRRGLLPPTPLDEQVLVVFDADGRLDPGLLAEARRAFADPDVIAAQARIRVRQGAAREAGWRGLLGKLLLLQQDLEFYVVRHIQLLRQRVQTVGLGGNGQFMRLSYLAAQLDAGRAPWPPVLLEDFASGLEVRLSSPRHRLVFLESGVSQQGLTDLRRFLRQRARWTHGNLQCAPALGRVWRAPMRLGARLDLTYFLAQPWLNLVTLALGLYYPARAVQRLLAGEVNWALTLTLLALNLCLPLAWVLLYSRENGLTPRRAAFAAVGMPVYMLIMMLSVPLAFHNFLRGQHSWAKTLRHAEA
ncbi:glycosyltransferase [Deinococcus budaensis]|uniref:Cellulose synthase/poly-beta-1,6-N-acetylglucosamine synthase-like glycosyltransferase n=1 Tax=Deinococcus budaensis TaxID=1665626 RepID=A0A7W8GHP0_9DEIO|nr:glycosyltransferase [Deinococcus budaensis]MBB5235351.1 cellulose synthase/poly-beta-1,6-N-acetylglucosamine synthase-like glycosyltransferase [Deinococcus budaensis]